MARNKAVNVKHLSFTMPQMSQKSIEDMRKKEEQRKREQYDKDYGFSRMVRAGKNNVVSDWDYEEIERLKQSEMKDEYETGMPYGMCKEEYDMLCRKPHGHKGTKSGGGSERLRVSGHPRAHQIGRKKK